MNDQAGPVASVRKAVDPWIENPSRDSSELLRWLLGSGLPPLGHDDEPYVWLLRALPRSGERAKWETAFADAAAELLTRSSEILESRIGDRAMRNLLGLCGGVRGRDQLPGPLVQLFRDNTLQGRKYNKVELYTFLRSALIFNQRDKTLEGVWRSMARGEGDPKLRGNPADGLQGLLYMPPSEAERGLPAVEAIGFGLTQFIHFLEDRQDKVPEMRCRFEKVKSRYPVHDWDSEFVGFSDRNRWPLWTDIALPNLSIRLSENRFIIWWPVITVMEEFGAGIKKLYNSGRICEVEIPHERLEIFGRILETAEGYRRTGTSGEDGADRGTLSTFCEVLKNVFRKEHLPEAERKIFAVQTNNAAKVFAAKA